MSWSHFVELLKLDAPLESSVYAQQAIHDKWSVPELQRQMKSSLFLRLPAGKDKDTILQLAKQGRLVSQPSDLLRDPFVFEFLKIPEPHSVSVADLETRLCDHLQSFLLELGKGFTFVGRQYRMPIDKTPFRVDLVFYHRILRCFVLMDLKIKAVEHHDIGRINLYLGYFAAEENAEGDSPPISRSLFMPHRMSSQPEARKSRTAFSKSILAHGGEPLVPPIGCGLLPVEVTTSWNEFRNKRPNS